MSARLVAGQDFDDRLELSPIDDASAIYVNGEKIGETKVQLEDSSEGGDSMVVPNEAYFASKIAAGFGTRPVITGAGGRD